MSATPSAETYLVTLSVLGEPRDIPLRIEDYPGLVSWYATSKRPLRLVTLWTSKDAFLRHRDVLCVRLGVELEWEDSIRSFGVPRIPFLRRIRPYQALMALAALIGSIVLIQNTVRDILQAPDLAIRVGKNDPIDHLEKTPFREVMTITNHTGTPHRDLAINAAVAGHPLKVTPSSIRVIDGAASKDVALNGNELKAGNYKLEARVTARAGIVHGSKPLPPVTATVRVWPSRPRVEKVRWKFDDASARLYARVHVGRDAPDGLDCSFYLGGHPEITQGRVDYPRVKEILPPAAGGGGATRRFRWTTKGIGSFQTEHFSVVVFAGPGTNLRSLPATVDLACDAN